MFTNHNFANANSSHVSRGQFDFKKSQDSENKIKTNQIYADWKSAVHKAFLRASHDSLTGLPNQSLFKERLRIALSEAKRRHEMLGVLFIDLDKFKRINDTFGHIVGDHILASVGERLSMAMRSEEIIARIGGDEFGAIIQRVKSYNEVKIAATRLLRELYCGFLLKDPSLQKIPIVITASIGISLYPHNGMSEEALIKLADRAMYKVKMKGGNGLEVIQNPIQNIIHAQASLQQRKKVLIIDDDPRFQLDLKKQLLHDGYVCHSSTNVSDGLKQVNLRAPDVVILDIGLRDASGLVFLQSLANAIDQGNRIPPVLVVSAHNDPEIIDFAKILGATQFLSKPIPSFKIASVIRSYA